MSSSSHYLRAIFCTLSISVFILGGITFLDGYEAWADMYFNSSEPGCDGSDPNVVMCDDFEHDANGKTPGTWYTLDCDQANNTGSLLVTKGWCGTIYANPITPPGAITCGGAGAVGTNCAANGGLHTGGQGGGNMADHDFAPNHTGYPEIYVRWYYYAVAGYSWGHEKDMTFNPPNTGGINCGYFGFDGGTTANTRFEFAGPHLNAYGPKNVQSGHWYYIEIHVKMNNPDVNGVLEVWMNDCGADGLGCGSSMTPTLIIQKTDVTWGSPCPSFGNIWIENWANPGSTGTNYVDQVKVSKVRVGPMTSGSPTVQLQPPTNLRVSNP